MLDENATYGSHVLNCRDSTRQTRKVVRGAAGTAGYRRGQVEVGVESSFPSPDGLGTDLPRVSLRFSGPPLVESPAGGRHGDPVLGA